jgi:hypothetical protein
LPNLHNRYTIFVALYNFVPKHERIKQTGQMAACRGGVDAGGIDRAGAASLARYNRDMKPTDSSDIEALEAAQVLAQQALAEMRVANELAKHWNKHFKEVSHGREKVDAHAQFKKATDQWEAAYKIYTEANLTILDIRTKRALDIEKRSY